MQLETMIIVFVILTLLLLIGYQIFKWVILTYLEKILADNPDDKKVLEQLNRFELLDTFSLFSGIYAGAKKVLEKNHRTEIAEELNLILEIKPKKTKETISIYTNDESINKIINEKLNIPEDLH